MRKLFCFFLCGIITVPLTTLAKTKPPTADYLSLLGQYRCHGFDTVAKKHYKSTLTIAHPPRAGSTYLLIESYPSSYWEKLKGVGFKYDNKLVAIFRDPNFGQSATVYTIDNGNLKNGEFIYLNHSNKGLGQEDCKKIK